MMFPAINKEQVRHHFSDHADEYDLYARVQKRVAQGLLELALDNDPCGPALDVGTGTGDVARRLLEHRPGMQIVVSDIAHDMTRVARENLSDVFAVDGDAQLLPFQDECFGLVLSSSVFQWIEELPAAFAECRRILRPGGLFAFAMFCDGTLAELNSVFRQALESCQSDWPYHFQSFPEVDEVKSAMQAAGFDGGLFQVAVEKEYHGSIRDLLTGLKRIGAQNAARSRPKGLFPRRVMQAMNRIYTEEFRTGEGLPASYGVLYGLAFKNE